MTNKYAVISGFLGDMKDRFCNYGKFRTIEEKFALAAQIEGVKGIELVYPYDYPGVDATKELMDEYELEIAAVNLNIKGEQEFRNGSYTHIDATVRKMAMEYTVGAIEAAADLGCNLVTCCPLTDGYDYAFHTDYVRDWKRLTEAVKEAAQVNPKVKFSLEYKPTEPRVNCYLDTAAVSLALCLDVDADNVGVTLDIGHALCAHETPAKSVALLGDHNRLFYIHVNDNNRAWDWDLVPGSNHLWAIIECLVYLNRYKHAGWFTADMMPARVDPVKGFSQTYRVVKKFQQIATQIDLDQLQNLVAKGDVTDVYELLWSLF